MNIGPVFRRPQPEVNMANHIISVDSHGEAEAQSKDRMPEASASEKWALPSSQGSGSALRVRPTCIRSPHL